MRVLKSLLLFCLVGCASTPKKTPFEACSEISQKTHEAKWKRYGSVEECVSEVRENRRDKAKQTQQAFKDLEKTGDVMRETGRDMERPYSSER